MQKSSPIYFFKEGFNEKYSSDSNNRRQFTGRNKNRQYGFYRQSNICFKTIKAGNVAIYYHKGGKPENRPIIETLPLEKTAYAAYNQNRNILIIRCVCFRKEDL